MQYVYRRYGRHRAAIIATVIHYRPRSAIRDVGKALGLTEDVTAALADTVWGSWGKGLDEMQVKQAGLDPKNPMVGLAVELATELIEFPRHLSQHVGGYVLTQDRLDTYVPIGNAAMDDRTFIEWDKGDVDALKMMKVDVLALGMLTCIRKCFDLIAEHKATRYELATVPQDDEPVYDMLCHADSIGVFQVESRAQMSMLPRLRPRKFYDLVIEVAIVRPGPIQGDMVHPYLRRRAGVEPVVFPSEALRDVLGKTLGVPLFQEQAMRIAIVAAGFTPAEADRLRRAMATFRHSGDIHRFRDQFHAGMVKNGYDRGFAERCFQQIEGFGEYGFPESHAASFALLVYVSAWLKCFHPEIFACALLNSQPMGFYAPAQIVRDAGEHGVAIRPVDVNESQWDSTIEGAALRLGLRQVRGLAAKEVESPIKARTVPLRTPGEIMRRAGLKRATLERLAAADAFRSLGLDRRQALWAVKGLAETALPLLAGLADPATPEAALPAMRLGEHVAVDYVTLGLSLKQHPMALLRPALAQAVVPAARLAVLPAGKRVTVAGLVLVRQRPGSASGVIFMTLEDESGIANLVVWPAIFERFRRAVMGSRLVQCSGRLQREGEVIHLIADRLDDCSTLLDRLAHGTDMPVASRNFH